MTDLEAVQGRGSGQAGLDPLPGTILDGNAPLDRLAARQYAADLKLCAARLAPRSRWAWFLRVFHDMPTRAIATHPAVQLKPGHVDVLLQRCRKILRDCMEQRGHDTDELPPGTFVALWSALRGTEGAAEDGLEEALPGVLNEPF